MNKTVIGLLFIICGVVYGSLAIDDFYNKTLGYLIEHGFLKAPPPGKNPPVLGRKTTIILYSFLLILIGIYLLWNRNI